MSGIALVIPVEKPEFVQLAVLGRVKLGHYGTVTSGGDPGNDFTQFFARKLEMFECFRGDDQIINRVFLEFGKEVGIIAFGPVSLTFQQGFEDRFVAASVIENGLDIRAMIRDEIDFFLKHPDIAFVIDAVFVLEIAFDFLFGGNKKMGGHKNKPAGCAVVVLAPIRFEQELRWGIT